MLNHIKIAKEHGVEAKIDKLHKELLEIPDVEKVEWDLTGLLEDRFKQVIFLLKYDIRANRDDYWDARRNLIDRTLEVIKNNDLYKTEDSIEDMGAHFYFVAGCKKSWYNNDREGM